MWHSPLNCASAARFARCSSTGLARRASRYRRWSEASTDGFHLGSRPLPAELLGSRAGGFAQCAASPGIVQQQPHPLAERHAVADEIACLTVDDGFLQT